MFKGFTYPVAVSASGGRVAVERDYDRYVRGLIYQVLLTRPGERINRPEFGAGVRALVFAPLSEATATLAQTTILSALREWLEAFILVEDVRVEVVEPSTLNVTVVYLVRATNEQRFLNVEVTE
ncbi:MAG: GPW/gp25 family protein [Pseudomonadota bacterium]